MKTLLVRATVYCAPDVEKSCLHVINYMLWQSATRNVSKHIFQTSYFGLASASVDVAILQLKGRYVSVFSATS